MVNDPVGDMLTRIRNAAMAKNRAVDLPYSKMKQAVAKILHEQGYLTSVEKVGIAHPIILRLTLAYDGKSPVLMGIKRISKPGLRWYIGKKDVRMVMGGAGISILSTPMGVMTGKAAKAKGIGGEFICEVW